MTTPERNSLSTMTPITIDCYLAEMCGSYYQLRENINQALSELALAAEVRFTTVMYDEAVAKGIMGSPSIWIKDRDIFPTERGPGVT